MSDTETLEWLVWFARKSKGTVAEVTQRALDQNPYLLAAAPRSGEGLREALHEAVNDVPWSTRTLPLYREDILKAIDYVLAAAPREASARVVSTRRADPVVIDPDAFGPVHGAPREASEPDA